MGLSAYRNLDIDRLTLANCFPVMKSLVDSPKYVHDMSYDLRLNDKTINRALAVCLKYDLVKKVPGKDPRNRDVFLYELTEKAPPLLKMVEDHRKKAQDYIERKCICDEKPGK